MADKRRRTEIQIETHEITIIRYSGGKKTGPLDASGTDADVQAYSEENVRSALVPLDECSNEQVGQEATEGE